MMMEERIAGDVGCKAKIDNKMKINRWTDYLNTTSSYFDLKKIFFSLFVRLTFLFELDAAEWGENFELAWLFVKDKI